MRYIIWFNLVPQIMKQLINSLVSCQSEFKVVMERNEITIHSVSGFALREDDQYHIEFWSQNNSKVVMIHRDNVKMLTVDIK